MTPLKNILVAILFCFLSAATLAALSGLTKSLPVLWSQQAMLAGCIVVTAGLTLVFARWQHLKPDDIGLSSRRKTGVRIAAAFGAGLALPLIQYFIIIIAGGYETAINPEMTIVQVLSAFALYGLVSLREEVAFRAFPLFSVARKSPFWIALALTTTIFILEHVIGGMSFWQACIGSGLGGILFGVLAIRTNGIAVPVGVHAAWNFGQWMLGLKPQPGVIVGTVSQGNEPWTFAAGWVGYVTAMSIGIFIAFKLKPTSSPTAR
jgi:membrane protease YdiL (CAAX protease family)